jgi:acetyl/propionyl-CoA carboxylase alpha subunit/acetyl-CoA carboxylase carboxyltransferase component
MAIKSLLIANRGEIAIRIARAAQDLDIRAVAIYTKDDEASLHVQRADQAMALPGLGATGYLDVNEVIAAAKEAGCDAIHPGYGFLSERADFAEACAEEGLIFVGPAPTHLSLFGNKAQARAAATTAGIPVTLGIDSAVTLDEAEAFFAETGGPVMLKAIAGGGGRGSCAVLEANDISEAYTRCQSEAKAAFGREDLYIEAFIPRARHIEVQIIGDGLGGVAHFGTRECSLQRRYQKLIEIAPAPDLDPALRDQIVDAALQLAKDAEYLNLGTFEFLVNARDDPTQPFVFIEANARLQVEHTVTEEIFGIDLVHLQLRLAGGEPMANLVATAHSPKGYAIQARVNMETILPDGSVKPGGGQITAYETPGGPGVRVDGFGYTGYRTSTAFDSLLAKVICHSPSSDFSHAIAKTNRALSEFRIEGIATNIPFLQNILNENAVITAQTHTRWVDEATETLAVLLEPAVKSDGFAGARIDTSDPLALFAHDAEVKAASITPQDLTPEPVADGKIGLRAPIQGTIVSIDVAEDDAVAKGAQVAIVEAMKMEHVITAETGGIVREVTMSAGETVLEGWPIVLLEEAEVEVEAVDTEVEADPDHIRADLQELLDRRSYTLDENREKAVEKRKGRGFRMIRESIDQLVDEGSFNEYWPLVVANQHTRHDLETLRKNTPGDGIVAGTASINGDKFGDDASGAVVVAYDYTVLAGTQGWNGHYKKDRMFDLAKQLHLPMIVFSEGGGGRPGDDVKGSWIAWDVPTFTMFSQLSGLVPMIGINNGRCFAGNTALLACCDVIIATEASTIGMGGPAMIEGGGLGVYTPEEVGPMSFQVPNGVVDILVKDEEEAVEVAKKYLSYFQGSVDDWEAADQRKLRHVIPEKRTRLYEMRDLIETLVDKDSILEIRKAFGIGVITCFARIEGRPVGIVANNPHHLAGALDSDGADKGARFLQLCDAFDIPVLSLMDCPGIMVGPDAEREALVRHAARMFNTGANLTTPLFSVVVRKGYGLGVQAMCGGSGLHGMMSVAWPTAEFAAMNIEGNVKLGYRNDLAAIEDPVERLRVYQDKVDEQYEQARAVNAATGGGLDDVIDPAETRRWIVNSMKRRPPVPPREGKKYPYIDTW